VEELDTAVTWEDIVGIIGRKLLVTALMNEAQCEFLDALLTSVVLQAGKARNVVATDVA
jgi:hypothetical protein